LNRHVFPADSVAIAFGGVFGWAKALGNQLQENKPQMPRRFTEYAETVSAGENEEARTRRAAAGRGQIRSEYAGTRYAQLLALMQARLQ